MKTNKKLCDRCEHLKTCDGHRWCRGFSDYRKTKRPKKKTKDGQKLTAESLLDVKGN